MHAVYVLKSLKGPKRIYIGYTVDLEHRLADHNRGASQYTRHFTPWQVETVITFRDAALAMRFETYLKSGSGHAFLHKRLITK